MSLIVNNTFDNFFEYWFTYDYERDKNQKNPFVPVTWEDYDGVNNSGHIWADDNRWTIDALENPVSIIPLIHYRGEEICDKGITYYHTNTVDFTNVTISFYLKKENLNLYNAHLKFWILKTHTRYYFEQELNISEEWTRNDIIIKPDRKYWHKSWSHPVKGIEPFDDAITMVDSYGISFIGFEKPVTGKICLDEFTIKTKEN